MKEKFKKNTLGGQEKYSKPNYIAEILSKGCLPCNNLGTILDVDLGRISTNGPEGKKTHDDAYGLTSQRWYRLC